MRTFAIVTLALLLQSCGAQTSRIGSFGLTDGGGTSSSGGGGNTSSSGGGNSAPPAPQIALNTTLAFTFLTTAPTNLGLQNGAVVNAASYEPTVASGGLAALIATSLPVNVPASDVTFPTTLDGMTLTVGGTAARLYLVAPTQISFQVPPTLAPGTYPVVVSQGTAEVLSTTATVADLAPGLLTAPNSGSGVAMGETVTYDKSSETWSGPVIFATDPNSGDYIPIPAATGGWLVLYGTGWENHTTATHLDVTLGSTDLGTPGGAVAQGAYPGLDELMIWLPSTLSTSNPQTLNLVFTVGTATSNTVQVCVAGTTTGAACPQ